MITRALDTQIKDFQKENDLKVDGVINPGGETEQTLLQKIAEKKKEQTAPQNNQKTKPKSHPFNLERIRETIKKDKDVNVNMRKTKPESKNIKKKEIKRDIPDDYIEKIEKTFEGYVDYASRKKLTYTKKHLEHFLEGSGEEIKYPKEEARDFSFIQKGEKVNETRFLNSFKNKKSKIGKKLTSLKENDRFKSTDNWDYKSSWKSLNPHKNTIIKDGVDAKGAFGTTNLNSVINFEAIRKNDIVTLHGEINHTWRDKYDFEIFGIGGAGLTSLEKYGKAKPFRFGSNWKKKFKTEYKIENNELKLINHQIEDIENKK